MRQWPFLVALSQSTNIETLMTIDRILVSVAPGEKRIASLAKGQLVDLRFERNCRPSLFGNIVIGRVQALINNLQAAFIDIGEEKSGYLEISDARPHDATSKDKIGDYLIEGETILVQITRDPVGEKGAKLTLRPVLSGYFLVFTPNQPKLKISNQILDPKERDRLKQIMDIKKTDLDGFIIRTSAQKSTAAEIIKEATRLELEWNEIQKKFSSSSPPRTLRQSVPLTQKLLIDHGRMNLRNLLTDDPETFKQLQTFTTTEMPDLSGLIQLYKGKEPLFRAESIEEIIEAAGEELVPLPSGGNIIINETSGLVCVDVNTGDTDQFSHEQMLRSINNEAAQVFAQQVRLRNLSGLMVIDFLKMKNKRHKLDVLKTLRRAIKSDPQPTFVSGYTQFGLVEITRQRKGLSFSSVIHGKTAIPSKSPLTTCLEALRRVLEESRVSPASFFVVKLAKKNLVLLETELSSALAETKERLGGNLELIGSQTIEQDKYEIHGKKTK